MSEFMASREDAELYHTYYHGIDFARRYSKENSGDEVVVVIHPRHFLEQMASRESFNIIVCEMRKRIERDKNAVNNNA